jgi:hypothetical protein
MRTYVAESGDTEIEKKIHPCLQEPPSPRRKQAANKILVLWCLELSMWVGEVEEGATKCWRVGSSFLKGGQGCQRLGLGWSGEEHGRGESKKQVLYRSHQAGGKR